MLDQRSNALLLLTHGYVGCNLKTSGNSIMSGASNCALPFCLFSHDFGHIYRNYLLEQILLAITQEILDLALPDRR